MAIGRLAKLCNAIAKPFEKIHQIQKPFRGQNLTKVQKAANCILKPLNFVGGGNAVAVTGLASAITMVGGVGCATYAYSQNNEKAAEKSLCATLKGLDVAVGAIGGFALGGPIGTIAGVLTALATDKTLIGELFSICDQKEDAQMLENAMANTRKELYETLGFSTEDKEEVTEKDPAAVQKQVIEDFHNEIKNASVGDTITAPIDNLRLKVREQNITLNKGDKLIMKEDSIVIIKENKTPENTSEQEQQPETKTDKDSTLVAPGDSILTQPKDSVATAPGDSILTQPKDSVATALGDSILTQKKDSVVTAPGDSILTQPKDSVATALGDSILTQPKDSVATAPGDSTQVKEEPVQEPKKDQQPTSKTEETEETEQTEQAKKKEETPRPAKDLFDGKIKGITTKTYTVQTWKSNKDCLWNIARRQLEAVNPGVQITNGQVLAQVEEFKRLNPGIKNPDIIYPGQEIKMCA